MLFNNLIFLHYSLLISIVESARILVILPVPLVSPHTVFQPLLRGLMNRGHEVVAITTDRTFPSENTLQNLTGNDLYHFSSTQWHEEADRITKGSNIDNPLIVMSNFMRLISNVFIRQLKHEAIQKLINDKTVRFDLLIMQEIATATLIFSHIFKAPVIQISSFGALPGNMEAFGTVTHPLLYPTHYKQRVYNLTLWEKINEFYNHMMFERILMEQELEDDKIFKDIFGHDVPSLKELKKNVDMIFLNVHPIWMDNQPVPPNVISISGIDKKPEEALPKDLQSYLDSSKNGVIYVSFGTTMKSTSIPQEKLEILLKVFSKLPYNILWKWDVDELPGKSQNTKISKWLPQSDLLRHPNIKLFITQGGIHSTAEAITAGVPLLGVPMIADQYYNTEKYVQFKIGSQLKFQTLNEESLQDAISSLINDNSYRKNIIRLRAQMHDQPQSPLERAIWWTEHVLRHGGAKHLRSPAAHMSWTEYYELNLVFILMCILIAFVTTISLITYRCIKIVLAYLKNTKIKTS